MLRTNIMFTIMFLLIMGVKEVKPLKCFVCEYHIVNKKEIGDKACKDVKASDTNSPFLKECDSDDESCEHLKGDGKGDGGQYWKRSCRSSKEERCGKVSKLVNDVEVTGDICSCLKDACNGEGGSYQKSQKSQSAPGVTLSSSTLMTLCLSWAVLRNHHHLY